jgi:protein transport protein SEC13
VCVVIRYFSTYCLSYSSPRTPYHMMYYSHFFTHASLYLFSFHHHLTLLLLLLDRTIKVYDISGNTYTHNATLTGHTGPIYQLSWSHPKYGPVLASCSFDTSVRIYREVRTTEWTLVKALPNLHTSSINSVHFAPHEYGLHVACASSDGRVSILSHDTTNDDWIVEYIQDTPLGVNSVSWAPYSSTTIVTTATTTTASTPTTTTSQYQPSLPRIVTGGCDNGIRIYTKSITTGNWEQESFTIGGGGNTITGHTDWVRDVAWCTNVIPDVSVFASASEDKTVIVWKQQQQEEEESAADANEGDENKVREGEEDDTTMTGRKWIPTLVNTFDDPVWRISWSITGNILAVSSGDSNFTLWKEALDGTWSNVSKVEDVAAAATTTTTTQTTSVTGLE